MNTELLQIPANTYGQRPPGDPKTPTRYEVLVDNVKIGEVYSYSTESWDRSRNGKIRTRFRGYSRTWRAVTLDGMLVVPFAHSRQRAVEKLLARAPGESPR